MKSAGVQFIRNEMDWDKYDPWGCVMDAQFALCEAWWAATGEQINEYHPSVWMVTAAKEGRLGLEMNQRARRIAHGIWLGTITREDIDYWMKVLLRTEGMVLAAGRDY